METAGKSRRFFHIGWVSNPSAIRVSATVHMFRPGNLRLRSTRRSSLELVLSLSASLVQACFFGTAITL